MKEMKGKYPYLAGLQFDNEDEKNQDPVHIILGAGDISKAKLDEFIPGKTGEPVAEKALLG